MKLTLMTALALAAFACRTDVIPGPSGDVTDLEAFLAIPVEARFARARADGDTRLLAVYGPFLSVPGVPSDQEACSPRTAVLPIPGTSDFYRTKRESDLNAQAWTYALEYNNLLLGQR